MRLCLHFQDRLVNDFSYGKDIRADLAHAVSRNSVSSRPRWPLRASLHSVSFDIDALDCARGMITSHVHTSREIVSLL